MQLRRHPFITNGGKDPMPKIVASVPDEDGYLVDRSAATFELEQILTRARGQMRLMRSIGAARESNVTRPSYLLPPTMHRSVA